MAHQFKLLFCFAFSGSVFLSVLSTSKRRGLLRFFFVIGKTGICVDPYVTLYSPNYSDTSVSQSTFSPRKNENSVYFFKFITDVKV